MKLSEKYAALVQELGELRVSFQAVAARLGSGAAAQRELDTLGAKLVALEESSGIAEARRILEHERTFQDDLPTFERILADHSPSADSAQRVAAGELTPEIIAQNAEICRGAKEAIGRIKRMSADVDARRKKLSVEALAIAREPDSLSPFERENWSRHFANTRAERASNPSFEKILKPLEPVAV